ncbi:MAG: nuclear transport factor 2 family protein [Chitinophagaceae bacterium]|nr:nuclear transport factor 2 family protein [Chitinophagaceae bacterium]
MADFILLDKDPSIDITVLSNIKKIVRRGEILETKKLFEVSPEILAQQQLNAYNLRDIEGFLEPYADSVEIYEFPEKLMSKGKDKMRKDYGPMFQQVKDLHCEVTKRIVQGNTVIDHETVWGFGPKPVNAVAIYKIENGKIAKVYFIQ